MSVDPNPPNPLIGRRVDSISDIERPGDYCGPHPDRGGQCPSCGWQLHAPHEDCEYRDDGSPVEMQGYWCAACGWEES